MTTAGDGPTVGAAELSRQLQDVAANVGSVLYGKREVVRLALACLAAGGHLLIEDLPGVGKTTLAKALAQTLGLHCRRVQFTADLLPSDLIGAMVLDRERMTPVFHPGPIFTNILLADELNRASPKAQSALLEAMEEGQVSVDGVTHPLPRALHGHRHPEPLRLGGHLPPSLQPARPLPAPHQHRLPGPPGRGAAAGHQRRPAPSRGSAGDRGCPDAGHLGRVVDNVHVAPEVRAYVLDLVEATRNHPSLLFGASPRAGLALLRTASGFAVTAGRDYLLPGRRQGGRRRRARPPPGRHPGGGAGGLLVARAGGRAPGQRPGAGPRRPRAGGRRVAHEADGAAPNHTDHARASSRSCIVAAQRRSPALLLGAEELVLLSLALLTLLAAGLVQSAHRAAPGAGPLACHAPRCPAAMPRWAAGPPCASPWTPRPPAPYRCGSRIRSTAGRGSPRSSRGDARAAGAPRSVVGRAGAACRGWRRHADRLPGPYGRPGHLRRGRACGCGASTPSPSWRSWWRSGPVRRSPCTPFPPPSSWAKSCSGGSRARRTANPRRWSRRPRRASLGDFSGIRSYVPGRSAPAPLLAGAGPHR